MTLPELETLKRLVDSSDPLAEALSFVPSLHDFGGCAQLLRYTPFPIPVTEPERRALVETFVARRDRVAAHYANRAALADLFALASYMYLNIHTARAPHVFPTAMAVPLQMGSTRVSTASRMRTAQGLLEFCHNAEHHWGQSPWVVAAFYACGSQIIRTKKKVVALTSSMYWLRARIGYHTSISEMRRVTPRGTLGWKEEQRQLYFAAHQFARDHVRDAHCSWYVSRSPKPASVSFAQMEADFWRAHPLERVRRRTIELEDVLLRVVLCSACEIYCDCETLAEAKYLCSVADEPPEEDRSTLGQLKKIKF